MSDRVVTERLVLRPLIEDDLQNLIDLDSDPEVVRYAEPEFIEAPPTPESHRPRLARMRATATFWAADEDGRFVGWFFLRDGELGYRLKRSAWGRGLATEGARAVLATADGPVHADVVAANAGSVRVMEKLGFVQTGEAQWRGMRDLHFELRR
jgi:RimJ/RimL family protein N-acetyltransferase